MIALIYNSSTWEPEVRDSQFQDQPEMGSDNFLKTAPSKKRPSILIAGEGYYQLKYAMVFLLENVLEVFNL